MTPGDSEWAQFERAFTPGQLVEGVVVAHRPFGILVDIGNPRFLSVVLLPSFEDDPQSMNPTLPAIGSMVKTVSLDSVGSSADSHA
jgi:ribosomal protein S1